MSKVRSICFLLISWLLDKMLNYWDKFAEGERITSHSYDDSEERLQENEAYASSVKTVAFWVSSLKIIVIYPLSKHNFLVIVRNSDILCINSYVYRSALRLLLELVWD